MLASAHEQAWEPHQIHSPATDTALSKGRNHGWFEQLYSCLFAPVGCVGTWHVVRQLLEPWTIYFVLTEVQPTTTQALCSLWLSATRLHAGQGLDRGSGIPTCARKQLHKKEPGLGFHKCVPNIIALDTLCMHRLRRWCGYTHRHCACCAALRAAYPMAMALHR